MGDTFNAFVKFISDDPIMLGLCIAIIVLVVLFIIVLIVGKKKETTNEVVPEIDKTKELLKTDIDLDSLKSTQEFSVSQINEASASIESIETPIDNSTMGVETSSVNSNNISSVDIKPNVEPQVSHLEIQPTEADLNIEPASAPIEAPIVSNEAPIQEKTTVIEPTIPVIKEDLNQNQIDVSPLFDLNSNNPVIPEVSSIEPTIPIEQNEQINEYDIPPIGPGLPGYVAPTKVDEPFVDPLNAMPNEISIPVEDNKEQIVESKVVPLTIDEVDTTLIEENQDSTIPEIISMDNIESKVNPPEESTLPIEPPFSSVYLSSDDVPDVEMQNASEPIKDINVATSSEDDFDDLELPKLNTSKNTTIFNEIKGESFNIEK